MHWGKKQRLINLILAERCRRDTYERAEVRIYHRIRGGCGIPLRFELIESRLHTSVLMPHNVVGLCASAVTSTW